MFLALRDVSTGIIEERREVTYIIVQVLAQHDCKLGVVAASVLWYAMELSCRRIPEMFCTRLIIGRLVEDREM